MSIFEFIFITELSIPSYSAHNLPATSISFFIFSPFTSPLTGLKGVYAPHNIVFPQGTPLQISTPTFLYPIIFLSIHD